MADLTNTTSGWQTSLKRDQGIPRSGLLGAFIDQFRIRVPGDNSRFYVRFPDGSHSEIWHKGRITPPPEDALNTVEAQNITVQIGTDIVGDYSILEANATDLTALLNHFGTALFGVGIEAGSGIAIDYTDPLHPKIGLGIASLIEDTTPVLSTTFVPVRTVAGDRKVRADRIGGSGGLVAPPEAADWTLVNPGTSTLTDITGGVVLTMTPASGGDNLRIAIRPVTSAPFTRALKAETIAADVDDWFSGLILRNSSDGNMIGFGLAHSISVINFRILKWDSETAYNSDYTPLTSTPLEHLRRQGDVFLHAIDDGTDLTFAWSLDGETLIPVFTAADNDFLNGIDQAGFYMNTNLSGVADFMVVARSWVEG